MLSLTLSFNQVLLGLSISLVPFFPTRDVLLELQFALFFSLLAFLILFLLECGSPCLLLLY
jgi:hypothetical protein